MSASELLRNIPDETLAKIKEKDPNPLFQAYTIAAEGKSNSHLVNLGELALNWFGKVLESVKEKVRAGIPVFGGHGKTNSHKGRTVIGRVVSAIQNMKNDVVAIIYRNREHAHLNCDVASFEAEIDLSEVRAQGHYVRPHEVGEITGIALGNSRLDNPAFPEAVLKAQVQCFEKGAKKMDLKQIKEAIQAGAYGPLDIFPMKDVLSIEEVQAAISENKGNENQASQIRRLTERNEKLQNSLEDAKAAHAGELKKRDAAVAISAAKQAFGGHLEKRDKLTESQKKYIERKKGELVVPEGMDPEKALDKFFDKQIKAYDEIKDIFDAPGKGKENITDGQSPAITMEDWQQHLPG